MNNLYFAIVNYKSPDIRTFPNLSIPPMEHVYLQRELTDRSEVSIEKGIQEMKIIEKHENLRELHSIQQSIYGNTAYLYRLLYDILSLFEKTFNQNSYIPSGGYYEDEADKYREIWKSIGNLLDDTLLVNSENLYLNHINESLVKLHSILLELCDMKTATACYSLRNYFSISPPNKPPKVNKYEMRDYITDNHSNRSDRLFRTFTKNPNAFKHLFLTSSIEIDPRNDQGDTKKNHTRVHFREKDIDIKKYLNLNTKNIGLLYHTLLSTILHDDIPNYTKPDNISRRYLAANTLATIIVMELLLIHLEDLLEGLKCFYNDEMERYTFSRAFREICKKVSKDDPIEVQKNVQNLHTHFQLIIGRIDTEKERYKQNFANYMNYIETKPQYNLQPIHHKQIFSV